jgi:nucleoside-diphosphate-sugar epimerase
LGLKGEPPITRFLAEELATSHWFDISAARQELGYQPRVSVEEGLKRLKAWLDAEGTQPVG